MRTGKDQFQNEDWLFYQAIELGYMDCVNQMREREGGEGESESKYS